MPSSDYTSAIPGGLKLKGAAKDSGIKKKKGKKPKPDPALPKEEHEEVLSSDSQKHSASAAQQALHDEEAGHQTIAKEEPEGSELPPQDEHAAKQYGKTEAQRRHEERRRKRLDERLQREGIKTHKERVEELNKYLSGLSEHHDMPRIGPG